MPTELRVLFSTDPHSKSVPQRQDSKQKSVETWLEASKYEPKIFLKLISIRKKKKRKKKKNYKTWCLCPNTHCAERCVADALWAPDLSCGAGPAQWFVLAPSVTSAVRIFSYVYGLLARIYVHHVCVPGAHGDQKRSLDPLESTGSYELLCRWW